MKLDFDVQDSTEIGTVSELRSVLSDTNGPVRVIGNGSKQARLPAPGRPVTIAHLGGMNRILRLDAEDMTCSVEPGISRGDFDQALAEKNLQLPCPDQGSLGGIFAAGEHVPLAPSAHSTRSLLLGMEGMLAEGLTFKSGAKVVKSVAGFDLQKLFIGSRGKMFVATCLHLKLRQRPSHRVCFRREGLDQSTARALFCDLRTMGAGPSALMFLRTEEGYSITGECTGNARAIHHITKTWQLTEGPAPDFTHHEPPEGHESLEGLVRPSRLEELIKVLPAQANLQVTGSGQFVTSLPEADADRLLDQLVVIGCTGEIRYAAASRRGLSTAQNSSATDLSQRLSLALDPKQRLA